MCGGSPNTVGDRGILMASQWLGNPHMGTLSRTSLVHALVKNVYIEHARCASHLLTSIAATSAPTTASAEGNFRSMPWRAPRATTMQDGSHWELRQGIWYRGTEGVNGLWTWSQANPTGSEVALPVEPEANSPPYQFTRSELNRVILRAGFCRG